MPSLIRFQYPVRIEEIHNGSPVGTDPDGDPIYQIIRLRAVNLTNFTLQAVITKPNGQQQVVEIGPLQDTGEINIPGNQRYDSWPAVQTLGWVRV